jgi:hypothetical protein
MCFLQERRARHGGSTTFGVGIGESPVHVCVQISLELMDRGSMEFGSHVLHMQYAMNLPSKIIAHRNGKLPAAVSNLFIIIP